MSTEFDEIEKQARLLPSEQKAALARLLIDDLDTSVDDDVARLWIEEANRRYLAYQNGELKALRGEEVMKRACSRVAAKCLSTPLR